MPTQVMKLQRNLQERADVTVAHACRATMGSTDEGAAGKGPARPPREQRRRSFVPDHVRNPQRYTCYDLGESITVGGGDQGASAADGGQADMERVMLCPTLTLLCIWMIYTFVQASKREGSLLCSGTP